MAMAVYVLCALTSLVCAGMLVRGYLRSRERLLLWASLCFVGLGANNVLLYFDAAIPTLDLSLPRGATALGGITLLLVGLVWEER